MNRRNLIIAACLVFLTTAVLCFLRFREPPQPSYQGNSLSEWLERGEVEGASDDFQKALNHIGTNAFPFLLKWVQQYPQRETYSRFRARLPKWLQRSSLLPLPKPESRLPYRAAVIGFGYYKEKAACAVPELVHIADLHTNGYALVALSTMGNDIYPELWTAYTNGSSTAGRLLPRRLYKPVSITAKQPKVLPMIDRLLADEEQTLVLQAVQLLGHTPREFALPRLTVALTSSNPNIRRTALFTLAEFGPAASSQVVKVRIRLLDENPGVRQAAQDALKQIAPEETLK